MGEMELKPQHSSPSRDSSHDYITKTSAFCQVAVGSEIHFLKTLSVNGFPHADGLMALTYSDQLDERYSEVVLIRHICVHVLLVDTGDGEAEQHQQRRYGEAEVEFEQT